MKQLTLFTILGASYMLVLSLVYTANIKTHTTSLANTPTSISFISALPNGQAGVPYPPTPIIVDGTPPFICRTESPLPHGMSLDKNGYISGTPQESGYFKNTFNCSNAKNTGFGTVSLIISAAPVYGTGKKVTARGVINTLSSDYIVVDNTKIYFTQEVRTKLKKYPQLFIGQEIQYVGEIHSDSSVMVSEIKL